MTRGTAVERSPPTTQTFFVIVYRNRLWSSCCPIRLDSMATKHRWKIFEVIPKFCLCYRPFEIQSRANAATMMRTPSERFVVVPADCLFGHSYMTITLATPNTKPRMAWNAVWQRRLNAIFSIPRRTNQIIVMLWVVGEQALNVSTGRKGCPVRMLSVVVPLLPTVA